MSKKLIAALFCIMIINLPLAIAQETAVEEFDEQETGESIIINVKSYEPAVLKSNILEDDDIDVYAFLSGYTPGSALSKLAKFEQQKNEPFYSQPDIKQVKVRPQSDSEDLVRNVKYTQPLKYTLDDLGTVIVRLKQIPAEKDMPKEITINMSAEVTFENAERLFSLVQQDLVLPEDSDEEAWKDKNPEEYAFFSGRGFIRATEIGENDASFVIYETQGYKEQATGWFTSIVLAVEKFVQTRSASLTVGETSDYIRFSEMNFVPEKAFRIKLNSIKDPSVRKARARVAVDGKIQNLVLYEGMPVFSGSSYKVKSIDQRDLQDGKKREDLTIQGPKGSFTATKTYGSKQQYVALQKKYAGDNKVIKSFQVSKIQETLAEYFPGTKFSVSAIASELTTEFEIKKDMTLSQALGIALPSQYTYSESQGTVEIKTAKETTAAKDICDGRVTLITNEAELTAAPMENIICTAINEYKELQSDYGGDLSPRGVSYRDEANYRIGNLYLNLYSILTPENQIPAAELAVQYLEKAVLNQWVRKNTNAQETLMNLKKAVEQSAEHKPIFLEDNGRDVSLTLTEIVPIPKSEIPHATVEIEGKGKIPVSIGDIITYTNEYAWKVKSIQPTEITLEKTATTNKRVMAEDTPLRLKVPKQLEGKTITLQEVQLNKRAHISIVPGTGKPLESKGNFTLHIPIEKRSIKLSPETIDSQLNQTQHWIEEIGKITTKLESIVKTWNTVCLATFAFLTVKNSFFLGFSRSQARRDTLYGADGNSGWSRYCNENSGSQRSYSSYDECMRENQGKIEKQIDETQNAKEKLDDEMDDYKNQQWYKDLTSEYKQIDKYGNYVGEEEFFTREELRNYRYSQLLKETKSYSELQGQGTYNLNEEVEKNLAEYTKTTAKRKTAYNEAVEAMQKYQGLKATDEQQAFNDIYRQKIQKLQSAELESDEFRELNKNTVTIVPLLRKDDKGSAYLNTESGKAILQQATVRNYIVLLEASLATAQNKENIQNEIDRMKSKYEKKNNLNAPLSTNQGAVYVDTKGKLYSSLANYDLSQINTEYKIKAVQIYPDGKPYCVPTGNGNYVKVLDFFEDGSPKTVQEWNVGTDGLVCSSDDIPIKHESLLNLPENEPEQRSLRSKAARIGKHSAGELIAIGGNEFTVETMAARANRQASESSCYDVMDPDDCSTLFGVCDPVMCPASRFNLGGTYQVDNVVQSGMIGSLVLGLHNFNIPKEPVPVCLTGILAGLKNIESVLKGYVQCLKEAQVTGKSVGICDQIRSIYICDIIYREVMSLFKARGGILTWMAKKVFGDGGGEYLNFQDSLQNAQKSVGFFTQEYARTAFAAYRGRSTEEIGKTICSVAIYGKLPKLGEVVDQLTVPESPPQFTAKLTVSPYAATAKEQKESYNIFYHIYAGENKKADYSVFLRNRAGDAYYATEKCGGRSATIDVGGLSSQSLDCVADAGFDEICVTINGITQCGFGKVTSSFSLNYMNDLIVEDEASRQIKTEEECVPDNQRYSSPLYGAISGVSAFTSTGIVRVCSVQNPGQGTMPENWKTIGTCGKDAEGRTLGSCWIDLRTVTITDVERMENTQRALQEAGLNATKIGQGVTYLLDKQQSEAELERLNGEAKLLGLDSETPDSEKKTPIAPIIALMQSYKALEEKSLSLKAAAESKYKTARVTSKLSVYATPPPQQIPGTAIISAEKKIQESKGQISEKLAKEIDSKCVQCDTGYIPWDCSAEECHGLGDECTYIQMFAGKEPGNYVDYSQLGVFDLEFWTPDYYSCHSCGLAKSCDYFNADKGQCENRKCTQQANLECEWDSQKSKCIKAEGECPTSDFDCTSGMQRLMKEFGGQDMNEKQACTQYSKSLVSCEGRGCKYDENAGCVAEMLLYETVGELALVSTTDKIKCRASESCYVKRSLVSKLLEVAEDLEAGQVLMISSARRTPEKQRELFVKHLSDASAPEACGPTGVPPELKSASLPKVQDLASYQSCPHVTGLAVDIFLCDSTKTGTKYYESKYIKDECGDLGYEDSEELQNLMCNAGWVGYNPERWHYEYGSAPWNRIKTAKSDECLYGSGNRKHVVSPV